MFAEYDYSQFPIVNVYFSSKVENNAVLSDLPAKI